MMHHGSIAGPVGHGMPSREWRMKTERWLACWDRNKTAWLSLSLFPIGRLCDGKPLRTDIYVLATPGISSTSNKLRI
ncbi:hypothetical protein M406DRAFT_102393 [Cryphonectria parasitica EP155]|uniref:Uncharacterized protein n=1 Tax=Cryphonectria parasitica (strain ATCC 38755 / EP155) TaxID=660469 RepID=A0A9P4Y249_CRYP1|nr:uncharacterized protein M406DRAFT_102393 [Cryphonectria parasitica EP155]KAF3764952.1 hypothetical protein M406DRAFT_102393 [Cryphonectria parasitica EP155]